MKAKIMEVMNPAPSLTASADSEMFGLADLNRAGAKMNMMPAAARRTPVIAKVIMASLPGMKAETRAVRTATQTRTKATMRSGTAL